MKWPIFYNLTKFKPIRVAEVEPAYSSKIIANGFLLNISASALFCYLVLTICLRICLTGWHHGKCRHQDQSNRERQELAGQRNQGQ